MFRIFGVLYGNLPTSLLNKPLQQDYILYSSTLFGLTKLSNLGVAFYSIFDEFYGDECRALSEFCHSFEYKWSFLGSGGRSYCKGGHEGEVSQINCFFYIEPNINSLKETNSIHMV